MLFPALITSLRHDTISCLTVVLIGSDVDPHCWIHNSFRSHVCQDLEGTRHLQKCEDEEEGIEKYYDFLKYFYKGNSVGLT